MTDLIPVFLFFGPQGSGKSTQGEQLANKLGWPYFDAGQSLRTFADSNNPAAVAVKDAMLHGTLVNNSILRDLFLAFMKNHNWSKGFVTDGFPRNESQIELLTELSQAYHWQITGIYIHITDHTAHERLAKRVIIVNGQEAKRPDDQPELITKRLNTFKTETLPVVNWLKTQHHLIEIDGEPEVARVTTAINQATESLLHD